MPNVGRFLKVKEEVVSNEDFVDFAKEELRNFKLDAGQEG